MIGTLVVSLPSAHAGGELIIQHNDEAVAYRASATEVTVAAFYADCRAGRGGSRPIEQPFTAW